MTTPTSPFASPSLGRHLARGALGAGALGLAIPLAGLGGALPSVGALALGVLALVAFRGCPVCWTVGLVETARARLNRAPSRPPP